MTTEFSSTKKHRELERQMVEVRDEIDEANRILGRAQAKRRRLAVRALRLGYSERQTATLAGVTGPAVHQWKEEAGVR